MSNYVISTWMRLKKCVFVGARTARPHRLREQSNQVLIEINFEFYQNLVFALLRSMRTSRPRSDNDLLYPRARSSSVIVKTPSKTNDSSLCNNCACVETSNLLSKKAGCFCSRAIGVESDLETIYAGLNI